MRTKIFNCLRASVDGSGKLLKVHLDQDCQAVSLFAVSSKISYCQPLAVAVSST